MISSLSAGKHMAEMVSSHLLKFAPPKTVV